MAVFEYLAKDSGGNEFSGVYTDVDNVSTLRSELAKMGYTLVKSHRQKSYSQRRGGKIKPDEIVAFAYEFAGMYAAGLSITRCLETFEAQTENVSLKSVIADIKQHVETGSTLKDAFGRHKELFSEFFVGMIEAGEAGGKLADTLQMAASYLEKQAELKRKVKAAFAYPVVVCVMCMFIVSALVVFVIPVFQKLYDQLNVQLPLPTLILILISEAVRTYWWIVVPTLLAIIFAVRKLHRAPAIKRKLDSFKLSMPVFGKLNKMVVVSRYVRTFAMMAKAGVTVVDSLELAKQVADNEEMSKVTKDIQESILAGSSLAAPMAKYSIFPPMIIQMAAAGEEAGILPEMLSKGVDFIDVQIDRTVKAMLVKIEPILSVLMGVIVGGILLGVYLPMFDYMGHVR